MKIPIYEYVAFKGYTGSLKHKGTRGEYNDYFFTRYLPANISLLRLSYKDEIMTMTEATFETWKERLFLEVRELTDFTGVRPITPPAEPHKFYILDVVREVEI